MNLKVHHSAPVLFVSALGYHIVRLFLLRHDGRGLPRSPVLLNLLGALVLGVSILTGRITTPEYAASVIFVSTTCMLLVAGLAGRLIRFPLALPAYLFVLLGQRMLELGIHYAGLAPQSFFLSIWVGVAMGALYTKAIKVVTQ